MTSSFQRGMIRKELPTAVSAGERGIQMLVRTHGSAEDPMFLQVGNLPVNFRFVGRRQGGVGLGEWLAPEEAGLGGQGRGVSGLDDRVLVRVDEFLFLLCRRSPED